MRRRLAVVVILYMIVVTMSVPGLATASSPAVPAKYREAAVEMGDWLVKNVDPGLGSWVTPWDPTRTDAVVSLYGVRQLKRLHDITGDKKYLDVAEKVMDQWVKVAFVRDSETAKGWTWAQGERVGQLAWDEGELEKLVGAFVSGFGKSKDGGVWVHSAEVPFCAGVIKPLEAMLEFGDKYAPEVSLVKRWLQADLADKMPASGGSAHRAYMTAQTGADLDGDGLLEVEYKLWGSRRQSAGMNAKAIAPLLEIGMKDRALSLADWLMDVMWDGSTGRFNAVYDIDKGKSMCIKEAKDEGCVNAAVACGLMAAYKGSGDRKYLDRALQALDWVIENETNAIVTGHGVQIYFTKPTVYGTHQVVRAMCAAYNETGRPKYLVYAIAGADWLLDQMERPFAGFGNNAWSVIETLDAIQSVIELNLKDGAVK
ncbi:MAG: hypothetical protein QME82_03080 [Bacillota bacterium]|nr:hypothetical protein [Bacillota bacterium]